MGIAKTQHKAWARERFRGLENVLIPSFSADLRELDDAGIRLDVRQSIHHGFFASQCALDSGLSDTEKRRFLAVATEEAAGRILISLSTAGESLEESIALLRDAAAAGVSHAAIGFPQSFTPRTQDDVLHYVRALAEACDLPLYLVASERAAFFHLHPSGVPLDAYEHLADLENIVGLHLGSLDAGLIVECCERFGDRLLVSSGTLGMLPMLTQNFGVQWMAGWTAEAVQSPNSPHAVQFVEHLRHGRMNAAMEIYWRLAPALGSIARVLAPLAPTGATHYPLLKYQQWLSGGNGGMTRQPCMRMFDRDMQSARAALRSVGIECAERDDEFFVGRAARQAGRA